MGYLLEKRRMIFSFTDLVISGTLLLNALTLVASKSSNIEHLESELELNMNSNREGLAARSLDTLPLLATSPASSSSTTSSESGDGAHVSSSDVLSLSHMVRIYYSIFGHNSAIMLQIRRVMVTIRLYSCIIAVWNILFMLLMLFVFRN